MAGRFGPYGGRYVPETLIAADPGYFLRTLVGSWAASALDENMDRYVAAFTPDTVASI